jgi:predicted glycoside hydrolase/deacetylase ChbG (UPF0249 family)
MTAKHLIVNADDFGLSDKVNQGIIRAHEHGILTSASLMVRQKAAAGAAECARSHPNLSVGLHVDLAEWVFRDGEWKPLYQVVPTEDASAVAGEVSRQLDAFESLVGKSPTHIDSHQHVHRNELVRSVLLKFARKLDIPLRECDARVRFCGDFYGQTGEGGPYPEGISVENLLRIFEQLPPGWTELGCHPGDDDLLDSVYRTERRVEMNTLCDERVCRHVQAMGIELGSFAELPKTRA